MLGLKICSCVLYVRTPVCVRVFSLHRPHTPHWSESNKQTNVDIFHFYCFFNCIFLFGILFPFLLARSQSVLSFFDYLFSVWVISTIAYFQFIHKICLNRFVVLHTRKWLKMSRAFSLEPRIDSVQWFVLINGLNCGIKKRGANQQKKCGTRTNWCIHELKMIGFEI